MLISTKAVLSIRFWLAHCSQSKACMKTCTKIWSTYRVVFTFTIHVSISLCVEQSAVHGFSTIRQRNI
ncbi:hypothetical protein [Diadegma fenestrale ichnovirus]|nr:hypothetical protein [Diadegma fenestrale ichnovirus]